MCVSVCAWVVSVGSSGKRFQTTEQDQSESAQARRFTSPSRIQMVTHIYIFKHASNPPRLSHRKRRWMHTLKPVPLCQCRPCHYRLILRAISIPYVYNITLTMKCWWQVLPCVIYYELQHRHFSNQQKSKFVQIKTFRLTHSSLCCSCTTQASYYYSFNIFHAILFGIMYTENAIKSVYSLSTQLLLYFPL